MADKGFIYIMTNKSFNREDWIKIGYTTNLQQRLKSLSNTGLPYDYELYAYYEVPAIDHMQDKALHNLIVKLNPKMRLVKNREFFEITPHDAYEVLELMATIHGTNERLHKCTDSVDVRVPVKIKNDTNANTQNVSVVKSEFYDIEVVCKGNGAFAKGKMLRDNRFVVFAGSRIADRVTPSLISNKKMYCDLRNDLINDGSINNNIVTKDIVFKSPSTASCVVLGRSSNGYQDWKTESGTPLKEFT